MPIIQQFLIKLLFQYLYIQFISSSLMQYNNQQMGTYLAQPITTKRMESSSSNENKISYSSCEMQGWRRFMEDAVICRPDIGNGKSLFAVFDGHGGNQVSIYVKQVFENVLVNSEFYKEEKYPEALQYTFKIIDDMINSDEARKRLNELAYVNIQKENIKPTDQNKKTKKTSTGSTILFQSKSALEKKRKLSFNPEKIEIEELISPTTNHSTKKSVNVADRAGCTANVVLITQQKIYVANLGDSRSIISRKNKSHPLSYDHKPEDKIEAQRILQAGGKIQKGRINGGLNLSRSFGDYSYKKCPGVSKYQQPVICIPEIRIIPRSRDDNFIFMGCDGVFETYYYEQQPLVDIIKKGRKNQKDRTQILSNLLDKLLAKDSNEITGCDNMSTILIEFN